MNPIRMPTAKQLAAIRASRRYRLAILVNRMGMAGSLSLFILSVTAPERAGTPYFVGVLAVGIASVLMLAWAGVPVLFMGRRIRSILMRDMLDVTWWSGPPPRR